MCLLTYYTFYIYIYIYVYIYTHTPTGSICVVYYSCCIRARGSTLHACIHVRRTLHILHMCTHACKHTHTHTNTSMIHICSTELHTHTRIYIYTHTHANPNIIPTKLESFFRQGPEDHRKDPGCDHKEQPGSLRLWGLPLGSDICRTGVREV